MKINQSSYMICMAVIAVNLLGADGTWSSSTGGSWTNTANWVSSTVADGSGSTAYLTTGSGVITNDATALTLLGVELSGAGYTLAGNTLSLDDAGFITVSGGSHTIELPLSLTGDVSLDLASGQTLTVAGEVSGSGGMTIYGGRTVLENTDNSYAGPTILVTGILETASVDALGDSSVDSSNFVIGEGTFRYTGPSATMSRGYTIAPTNRGTRASVIDVTNADTTLTIAGKVSAPSGSFIKTGEGTLKYTYPGYQELNKSRDSVYEASDLVFDENGSAGTNGYAQFTVDKGRLILGAPGQTNNIYAVAWVGSRTLASPRMDIVGGVTRVLNTYFTIGRGTGTTTSPQQPSVYVSGGALFDLSRFVMGYANSQPGFYSEPYLEVDNATMIVQNDCFLSENPSLHTTVTVTNNALFQCNSFVYDRGMSISQSAGADTDVNFGGASTGRTYGLRVGSGGTLSVAQGSVFELDHTPYNVIASKLNKGTVRFDDGTLKQRSSALASDWLVGLDDLQVGSGDMTVNVEGYAMLDASPSEDPSSTGGEVLKTGVGTLAIPLTELDVQVNDGSVLMAHDYPWLTDNLNGTLQLASGTKLDVLGASALGDMTVAGSDLSLEFHPHSLSCKPEQWDVNGWAKARNDGMLQLVDNKGSLAGSLFNYNMVTVNQPWTAHFSYQGFSTQSRSADGVVFVLQNDPRGTGALGGGGGNIGYAGASEKIVNSIAVAIDVYNERFRLGKQGVYVGNQYFHSSIPYLGTFTEKVDFEFSYDGSGVLSCRMSVPGYGSYTYDFDVDVAAEVADSQAYLGFTAATGGSYGQHCISDLIFEDGSSGTPDYCRHGGQISLGSGDVLSADLIPSVQQKGFVLGTLNYADQSVIDVNDSGTDLPPEATLADQGMWDLNGFASWKPDGGLSVSAAAQNSSGTAYTTNRYPITSSWVARFKYDQGERSGAPADYISFCIQNKSSSNADRPPVPGFLIQWRYYEDSYTATQVKMVTNNVTVLGTNDASPVDLVTGGTAEMTVAWDETTRDVTVTTVQAAGTNITVFSDVDISGLLAGSPNEAYLGFVAYVGGLYCENIVSDFSFTSDALLYSSSDMAYLAADTLDGSGTLIKRGSGALGLLGYVDQSTDDVTLQLEEGGLVLKKLSAEVPSTLGARSDWMFTPEGKWAPNGALQFCTMEVNSKGTAMSTRRVRITEPWVVTYSFDFGAKSSAPADAYSFFLHNDPRGPGITGGQTSGAGYTGISNSIGLRWYFYPNNNTTLEDSTSIGRNGSWDEGSRQSHVPISLVAGPTDFMVVYDPTNATLTSIMSQGVNVITNTFNSVNIPTDVGDDYAYIAFGGGCGGAFAEMRVSDFTLTYTGGPVDDLADRACLANLILPAGSTNSVVLDTPVADGLFNVTAATVGDGASLTVASGSVESGTLVLGTATLNGDAVFDVQTASVLSLSNTVSGASVAKLGGGVLTLTDLATYTGDTLLQEGTLLLPAANLPETTGMEVSSSATLSLQFSGKQYVDTLTVDGVQQPGGAYTAAGTSWIEGSGRLIVRNPASGTFIILR